MSNGLSRLEWTIITAVLLLVVLFPLSGCGFIRTDSATYLNGQLITWESTTAWTLGKTISVDANDFGYLSEPQDAQVYSPYGVIETKTPGR